MTSDRDRSDANRGDANRSPTGVVAVVFDLDGVLLDSEPVWEDVRRGVVAEHGGQWPPDAQKQLMGMSTREWATYLSHGLGVDRAPRDVAALVIDRMSERYRSGLPLIPGADDAVHRLAEQWPLGLASSSPRRLIDAVLVTAGWQDLFASTVSSDEVTHGKPAPDVYREAVTRLRASPSETVAVEDSTNGIRAAAAAGLIVVAIPRPRYPVPSDTLTRAARVLPTVGSLTAEVLTGLRRSVPRGPDEQARPPAPS